MLLLLAETHTGFGLAFYCICIFLADCSVGVCSAARGVIVKKPVNRRSAESERTYGTQSISTAIKIRSNDVKRGKACLCSGERQKIVEVN